MYVCTYTIYISTLIFIQKYLNHPLIMAEKSPGIHGKEEGKLCDVILYLLHMILYSTYNTYVRIMYI